MRLYINQIESSGTTLEGQLEPAELKKAFAQATADVPAFCEPLSYRLRARMANDVVEVEGHIATVAQLSCSRCLKAYRQPLEAEFAVAFVDQKRFFAAHADAEDGVELDPESLELDTYTGDEIDLKDTLCEQFVLALPPRPLCREECAGLCPHCGADLNRDACSCDPEPFNNKFSALKGIKLD